MACLRVSEVAGLQVCDLWTDHFIGYGIPGYHGTCAVHVSHRKNDSVRKGHLPGLGRAKDPELDIVYQLKSWVEWMGLQKHEASRAPRGGPLGLPRLRRMASRFIDRLAISCRRGASPARMGRLTPTVKGGGVPARHVASAYVLACLGGESRRTTSPRRGCPSRVTRGGPRAESRDPSSRPLPPVSAVTR